MGMPGMSPPEVAARLEAEKDAVYLDVRTIEEFDRVHAPGAYNVPIYQLDPGSGQMEPNTDFVDVVQATIGREVEIHCGCASGQRSLAGAMILSQHGFTNVTNFDTGFSGKHDAMGQLLEPGWEACGLPVEPGDGGERGYAALRRAAGLDP